jgi:hypothetical protein
MANYRRRRRRGSAHLATPGNYRNDRGFQDDLDDFFLEMEGRPTLETLEALNREFRIGGAVPFLAIREIAGDRKEKMIVARHSKTGATRSTNVPAGEMKEDEARAHPDAQEVLAEFAADVLFELQIRNAPATVRFSTAIARWLATRDPNVGNRELNRLRKSLNKKRNVRDPAITFDANKQRATRLIDEFFQDRRLGRWNFNLVTEIKTWLVREARERGATEDRGGQVKGALDTNVAKYFSIATQTRDWLIDTFQPPISMELSSFNPQSNRSEPLTWREARLILLFALGYVWENGGFAQEYAEDGDGWRVRFKKLPEPQLTIHRAKYFPLLRAIPLLFTTGTRPNVAIDFAWTEQSYRGWVCLEGKRSRIRRRGEDAPDYRNKPRKTSPMLPLARGILGVFRTQDLRKAEKDRWIGDQDDNYVVHNGRGGPATDVTALFGDACGQLGIKNSIKKLKHACVTALWLAGFDIERIANWVGTDPKTTREYYLYLEYEYAGLVRPHPDAEKMTFVDLVDPYRDMPPIPRGPVPPHPTAHTAVSAEVFSHAP